MNYEMFICECCGSEWWDDELIDDDEIVCPVCDSSAVSSID